MKKLVTIIFVTVFCSIVTLAQESAICGDWIGIARETAGKIHPETGNVIKVDEKLFIRIKQINGNYQVRMKAQIADGSRPFSYLPECKVTSVTDNIIRWSQDWGSNEEDILGTEQGVVVGRDSQIAYYTGIVEDGIMKLSEEYIITYYDRQGRKITSKSFPASYTKGVTLYKEDSDW